MTESVFLSPKSIAVVGASDKEGSVGRAITSNIMKGYKGTVFPISPSRDTVFDQKAYKSVLDVPEEIDLAVVITKNTIVPTVLEECGKKKIQGAIVITAENPIPCALASSTNAAQIAPLCETSAISPDFGVIFRKVEFIIV